MARDESDSYFTYSIVDDSKEFNNHRALISESCSWMISSFVIVDNVGSQI